MKTITVIHNGLAKEVVVFPNKRRGLGDLVEVAAKPIAHAADKLFGTNLKKCGGCKKRKRKLNRIGEKLKRLAKGSQK